MNSNRPAVRAATRPLVEPLEERKQFAALTAADVQTILAQAASQVKNPETSIQSFVVTDRDGRILGGLAMGGLAGDGRKTRALRAELNLLATYRSRTAAFFQSTENAFTTRSARYIIQDNFPAGVNFTPGGPLYGVEFSNLAGSDIVGTTTDPKTGQPVVNASGSDTSIAVSGDPGAIPLYKDSQPVGGIGVAGDGRDLAAREDLRRVLVAAAPNYYGGDPKRLPFYTGFGREERDVDEQLALAGAQGYLPPEEIEADRIFIDGLALPYTADEAASGQPNRSFSQLIASGDAVVVGDAPRDTPPSPFPAATFGGVKGFLKNTTRSDFGIVSSNDSKKGVFLDESERLTRRDVRRIIADAAKQSRITRAGIRKPIGVNAEVHIAVVDRDGDVLGVFKTADGTNFSFDVAVQKARTAAFFSDNAHAFTSRAIGFMSQQFFPPGLNLDNDEIGPLYKLQDALSPALALNTFKGEGKNPLKNGITVFAGGLPLYKNGKLVGAIGISGDGIDQDELVGFAGAKRYQPPKQIRSDFLAAQDIATFITGRVALMNQLFTIDPDIYPVERSQRLFNELDFRLPYVKFPRNPETNGGTSD
jgi:uncharacterized protein GlcG (DUF336 family)